MFAFFQNFPSPRVHNVRGWPDNYVAGENAFSHHVGYDDEST